MHYMEAILNVTHIKVKWATERILYCLWFSKQSRYELRKIRFADGQYQLLAPVIKIYGGSSGIFVSSFVVDVGFSG